MKNTHQLSVIITCSKEEMIARMKEYKHESDYVVVCESNEFDILLGLTWKQHSKPHIEYYYQANILDDQITGEIVKVKSKVKFMDVISILWYLFIGLLSIYGLPFIIIYGISDELYLSLSLASIPLLGLIFINFFKNDNHIQIHKKNIIETINQLSGW